MNNYETSIKARVGQHVALSYELPMDGPFAKSLRVVKGMD